MAKRKRPEKPIAYQERTIAQEELPLPCVHYPSHYGTFIAYSESPSSQPQLCTCSRFAVQNYVARQLKTEPWPNSDSRRMFVIDSHSFPLSLVDLVSAKQVERSPACMDVLSFGEGLCHRCNGAVPSYRWCHEMYGSPFKQTYGWYLQQMRVELGVFDYAVDFQLCTDEIRDLLVIDPNTFIEHHTKVQSADIETGRKLYKDFTRQTRQVDRVIENLVRERLGFPPMGSGSTGESILFQIVKRIFPREPIHRCSRPDFLEGLELDVFLPGRSLAFEFQGQQHYVPVEHWGGINALEDLRKRDERKRSLCQKHGIDLIEIRYDDPLTEDNIGAQIETKNRTSRDTATATSRPVVNITHGMNPNSRLNARPR